MKIRKSSCLTDETIDHFADATLPKAGTDNLRLHIASCEYCRERVSKAIEKEKSLRQLIKESLSHEKDY